MLPQPLLLPKRYSRMSRTLWAQACMRCRPWGSRHGSKLQQISGQHRADYRLSQRPPRTQFSRKAEKAETRVSDLAQGNHMPKGGEGFGASLRAIWLHAPATSFHLRLHRPPTAQGGAGIKSASRYCTPVRAHDLSVRLTVPHLSPHHVSPKRRNIRHDVIGLQP